MDLLNKINDLNLNNNLFTVSDYSGLSLNELLSKYYTKINEIVKSNNDMVTIINDLIEVGVKEEVIKKIQALIDSGELEDLIKEEILNDLLDKIMTLESKVDENCNSINDKIGTLSVLINLNKDNINLLKQDIESINKEINELRVIIQDKDNNNNGGGNVETPSETITTKIAIDCGHDVSWDPGCSWYGGGNEAQHTRQLGDKVIEILSANGCVNIFDSQSQATGTTSATNLKSRTTLINNWGADLSVSLHFNSNTGTPGSGTETYVIGLGGKAETLAKRVNNLVAESMGITNRGVKVGNLAMVRDTICPAILVEVCFANNQNDVAKYDVNKVATAIAEGILNKSLNSNPTEPESSNYLNGKVDKEGLRLIKSWEGFGQTGYADSQGYITLGFGTTQKWQLTAYNMMLPTPTTEEKATNSLVYTLENDYGKNLFNYIAGKGKLGVLNQNRFNALVSLVYNKGLTNLTNSTLLKTILEDPTSGTVETLFKSYQTLPGTASEQGLKNRRISEYDMYCGINCTRSISIYKGTSNTGTIVTANNGYGYIPSGY